MTSIQATGLSLLQPGNGSNNVKKPKSFVDPEKAWKAAQEFETTFTSHLIQQLFAENKTGMFGGGQTEVMFRSFWSEKIAESMPGMFGVAESVFPVLMKDQANERTV
jgi:Rod binding domain-containing protein